MTQEEWNAIKNRDPAFDGEFYYSLLHTGVYCRPSCEARKPVPERLVIYRTREEAEQAGLKPCRKCLAAGKSRTAEELAERLAEWIRENRLRKFSLDRLAGDFHMDKNYLLRVFHQVTGHTLLEYHNLCRVEQAKELLTHPEYSIAFIATEVGYKTSSHFVRIFRKMTGATPAEYRKEYFRQFR